MRIEIPLTSLLLDQRNPRLEVQTSHRDAIRTLTSSDPQKMLSLVEDVVDHGLNPLDNIGVSQSSQSPGRYLVREGNRRVAALLILHNPDIIKGAVSSAFEEKIRRFSARFLKERNISSVEGEVRPDDQWDHWITLRHTGVNEGRGLVPWGTVEQSRYLQRTGAPKPIELQFLDRYAEYVSGDEREQERIKRVPASSLRRLLDNAAVRKELGISVNAEGWAYSDFPHEEMFKWLRRIVHDLADSRIRVKDIYTTEKMLAYVSGFSPHEQPDSSKALKDPIPVEPVSAAQPKPKPPGRKVKIKLWSLKELNIAPKHSRLRDIIQELQRLAIDKSPNIHAVMLRVFVEMSVDDYLAHHKITVPPDRGTHTTLGARIKAAADRLESQGVMTKKQLGPVRKIAGTGSRLQSMQTLHDFVHNENFHPNPTDVETLWKDLGPFTVNLQSR